MRRNVEEQTRKHARELRRDMTPAEKCLWHRIRGGRLHGLQVRRQHPIGPYIADFYIPELRLVIELDGDSHDNRIEKDRVRDRYLSGQGCAVIRFQNRDITHSIESVLEYLWDYCKRRGWAEQRGRSDDEQSSTPS